MKKAISCLTSTLVTLLFTFQTAIAQDEKDSDFNFPPDFGKKETIILIAPGTSDKITESVMEAFEKNYKGKFELCPDKQAKAKKYQSGSYQYIFMITEKVIPGKWVGRERIPPTTDYKFGLYDLRTGKMYDPDFWSGSYKKGAKYYVKHLEEFRSKNSGQ
ncbi:MAG: hypothetical protein HZA79_07430 [Sphingobacteriales bacterium]|nr:hypothetical protein [Sphingobacteriales bacterium]